MDADADGKAHAALRLELGVELTQVLHDGERGMRRALRVVFVGLRPAEEHEDAVAAILRRVPRVALDGRGTGLLVAPDDGPEVLGVETRRQRRRAHQVAEHDGEMTTLAAGGAPRASPPPAGCVSGHRRPALGAEARGRCDGGEAGGTVHVEQASGPDTLGPTVL